MTETVNYKLKKPGENDWVDINVLNENADAIDAILQEKLDAAQKGAAGGVAALDERGKILGGQLPEMNYDPAGSADAVQTILEGHAGNKNNPHGVTAAQIGAEVAGSASVVQGNLTSHINNRSNPHGVTAAQVGADPAGTGAAVQANLTAHINNRNNPHGVTAAQLGAAGIIQGYYTGDGKYGGANPNSLTFNTAPKFVMISQVSAGNMSMPVFFVPTANMYGDHSEAGRGNILSYGTTISWWGENAFAQLNGSGVQYLYTAIL